MLGLTLAYRLAEAGDEVTVIEARPSLGGLADAWSLGDVRWDRHYHVILLSDTRLRKLLRDLELEDSIRWVETKTGFYCGGKFYSLSNTTEFLKFPPLNLLQKLRLGGTIFYASKVRNWRRMEQISVESWLRRWSGDSTFEAIWLPLLRAKLGNAYRRTAASFIWAYISRMYKARRTGHKKEMFGYVPGGYGRIIDRLSAVLAEKHVRIDLNQSIRRITTGTKGNPTIEFDHGGSETFDRVLLTVPAPVVPQLCPDLAPAESEKFRRIEYLGIVCASLLLTRPLGGYYVTNITDDVPFTAVIEMSTIVDPQEFGGQTLVYLPKYATLDDPVMQLSDDEIRRQFFSTLQEMYPDLDDSQISAFRVSRARYVMAIPTIDYSQHLPPLETSLPGVFAINSAHIVKGNLNVNETITVAEEALASVFGISN